MHIIYKYVRDIYIICNYSDTSLVLSASPCHQEL